MYDHYNPGPEMGEHIGIDFLKMDGIQGLLFVANRVGALLMVNPEAVHNGYLLSESLEICGEQPTLNALREAGATNPSIEKYWLAAEEEHLARRPRPRRQMETTPLRYEQLFNEVPLNKPFLFMKWGEHASDEELELAAKGLIAAKDSKQKLAHLRIFARRPFPLDVELLTSLVDIEEDRVGWAAIKALTHVLHPAVRALAFRLVETQAQRRGDAIALMARNFERGDHNIVLPWFEEEQDREARHSMGSDLTDFWKQHPDGETEIPMLRSLYEKGPCSVCREKAVMLLIERSALPIELRAECAWDANGDIRDLVATPANEVIA